MKENGYYSLLLEEEMANRENFLFSYGSEDLGSHGTSQIMTEIMMAVV